MAVKKKKKKVIETVKATRPDVVRVSAGEVKNIITDTLEKCMFWPAPERANAEAEAEIITRSLMYEDGGVGIRNKSYDKDMEFCSECG